MNHKDISSIDSFCKNLKLSVNGQVFSIAELLPSEYANHQNLTSLIRMLITQLNDGIDFGEDLSNEWTEYLLLVLKGYEENLKNPYGDIDAYQIQPLTDTPENFKDVNSIRILNTLPNQSLNPTTSENLETLSQTILIIAIGGTDTTFYKELTQPEIHSFAKDFYGEELYNAFDEYDAISFIPRGFAAKRDEKKNVVVTNVESNILHAYHAGIRNVAIIGNSKSYKPISKYLKQKLNGLEDLNIAVVPQPLLPIIQVNEQTGAATISLENGGYPGGHGHGFKYCLDHPSVRKLIQESALEYFIFGNGDNSAILNWGANHFAWAIHQLKISLHHENYNQFRIAFFLVWEHLRKGGFAFLLSDKASGEQFTQIIESELAEKSGANLDTLRERRGGYNTNVATGIIENINRHFKHLPFILKRKNNHYMFEASLGTGISTSQDSVGRSSIDSNTVMTIMGPKEATFQHWNHISIRKRDDLFAFQSSLFYIREVMTDYKNYPVIVTNRDATKRYPYLKGDITNPDILSTKDFYEIFQNTYFDVNQFTGCINVNLLEEPGKLRGQIKFEGTICLTGDGELCIDVHAGELWIIKDIVLQINDRINLSKSKCDIKVLKNV